MQNSKKKFEKKLNSSNHHVKSANEQHQTGLPKEQTHINQAKETGKSSKSGNLKSYNERKKKAGELPNQQSQKRNNIDISKLRYKSLYEFFDHFIYYNNFYYDEYLSEQHNFEILIEHLKIKFYSRSYFTMKNKFDALLLLEKNSPPLSNINNTVNNNYVSNQKINCNYDDINNIYNNYQDCQISFIKYHENEASKNKKNKKRKRGKHLNNLQEGEKPNVRNKDEILNEDKNIKNNHNHNNRDYNYNNKDNIIPDEKIKIQTIQTSVHIIKQDQTQEKASNKKKAHVQSSAEKKMKEDTPKKQEPNQNSKETENKRSQIKAFSSNKNQEKDLSINYPNKHIDREEEYDYHNNQEKDYFKIKIKKNLEESFLQQKDYIYYEKLDFDYMKDVDSTEDFFNYFIDYYYFTIKKKQKKEIESFLNHFYRLADYMEWRNLLLEKKIFYSELTKREKEDYIKINFSKYKLNYVASKNLKNNFLHLAKYMKWQDCYSFYYKLFVNLFNQDLLKYLTNTSSEQGEKLNFDIITNRLKPHVIQNLDSNLCDFEKKISATENQNENMLKTICLFEKFLYERFDNCTVEPYGSFTQDLHLRNSDIDIVIFNNEKTSIQSDTLFTPTENKMQNKVKLGADKGEKQRIINTSNEKKFLRNLKNKLIKSNFSDFLNTCFIDATVPIIKTKCLMTDVKIDIR